MFVLMRQAHPRSKQLWAVGAISLGREHKFCMFQLQSIGIILTSSFLQGKLWGPTLVLIPQNDIVSCLIQAHDYMWSCSRNYVQRFIQMLSFLSTRSNRCRLNNSNLQKNNHRLANAGYTIIEESESVESFPVLIQYKDIHRGNMWQVICF